MIWQTTLLIQVTDWLGSIKNMAQSSGGLLSVLSPFFILCVYGRITNNGISVYTQQSSTEIERICWFIWDNGFAFLSDPTLLLCGISQGTCTQILSCGACLKCLQDLVKRFLSLNLANVLKM